MVETELSEKLVNLQPLIFFVCHAKLEDVVSCQAVSTYTFFYVQEDIENTHPEHLSWKQQEGSCFRKMAK